MKLCEFDVGKDVDITAHSMRTLTLLLAGLMAAGVSMPGMASTLAAPQQDQRPVFRSSAARVTLAVTVRDRRGRPVTNLTPADFSLLDRGQPRVIQEFSRDAAPVGIALLADVSGSMDVAEKKAATRQIASQLVASLRAGEDQVGLFAFDRGLEEVQALGPAPGTILEGLDKISPYGRTSLFDAIADTGRRLAASAGPRRAVVVLTDGYDNASRMTPEEVSAFASSIDVPVYVIVVHSPFDRAGTHSLIQPSLSELRDGPLGNLARWTGGDILMPVTPAELVTTMVQFVSELRHQYLMAFEPGREPGWHALELRTRRSDLIVRARSGYLVPGMPGAISSTGLTR